MRVLLTALNAKYIHSNLALRYLRAAMAPEFPDVAVREFTINDDLRQVSAEIYRLAPDVICFSAYIWNITETLCVIADLKQVVPDAIIIMGGPEAGTRADELLNGHREIDYIIDGEGELSLPALLKTIGRQGQVDDIPGLHWRKEGQPLRGAAPAVLAPDQVPSPYIAADLPAMEHRIVYYESSRGCPFGCSYCLSSRERLRYFSLERVSADLDLLLTANVPLLKFVDRTYNSNPARARTIMEYILAHRRDTRAHFEICADLLDRPFLDFLAGVPAGAFQFEIGVQSTNPRVLEAIGRRMDWTAVAGNVRQLKQNGNIPLHLDLIAGLPYEDWPSFSRSFDDVINLFPDELQLGFLKVLPGTEMAARSEEYGLRNSVRPPYEVLATNWISFAELNRLHTIEALLNILYNGSLTRNALPYVWRRAGGAFALFDALAGYWESRDWHLPSFKPETAMEHVREYLDSAGLSDEVTVDLLALDSAATVPSFPATFHLPPEWAEPWNSYLDSHRDLFTGRMHKEIKRTVYPVRISPATVAYLGAPEGSNAAVVDRQAKRVIGFVNLP